LEVNKPVVRTVEGAQGAGFRSMAQSVTGIQDRSHPSHALRSAGHPRHGADVLPSHAGHLTLLAGHPAMAWLSVDEENEVRLPGTLFYCSDPREKLYYSCAMANGDPLPSWLDLDAPSLTYTGMPPDGETGTLDIVVTARSDRGHKATAKVVLRLGEKEGMDASGGLPGEAGGGGEGDGNDAGAIESGINREADGEDGMPGLSAQLGGHGRSHILKAAKFLSESLRAL